MAAKLAWPESLPSCFVTGSVTGMWQFDDMEQRLKAAAGHQGTDVRFAVIEGSREWTEPARRGADPATVGVLVEDVEAEARRRLRRCHIDEWRTREFITGRPMPHDIRHFVLQVEFAARAISRLSPIPGDYNSDIYWPTTPAR